MECSEVTMSTEFDGLDAKEKAALARALERCRALSDQIESELRNKKPSEGLGPVAVLHLACSRMMFRMTLIWRRERPERARRGCVC